jgi:hypothetical protein
MQKFRRQIEVRFLRTRRTGGWFHYQTNGFVEIQRAFSHCGSKRRRVCSGAMLALSFGRRSQTEATDAAPTALLKTAQPFMVGYGRGVILQPYRRASLTRFTRKRSGWRKMPQGPFLSISCAVSTSKFLGETEVEQQNEGNIVTTLFSHRLLAESRKGLNFAPSRLFRLRAGNG